MMIAANNDCGLDRKLVQEGDQFPTEIESKGSEEQVHINI